MGRETSTCLSSFEGLFGEATIVYVSQAAEVSIGVLLAQDNDEKKKQAMYYLSRFLNPVECAYSFMEKLCLSLYFAAMKLRYYILPNEVYVIAKFDTKGSKM